MILNSNSTGNQVIMEGQSVQTSKMEMDQESIAFLMHMISTFYSDSIGSPIRETVSNGWDSHKKAGQDKPILVKLSRLNYGIYQYSVRDYGMGIDLDLVENVIKKYGKSTKRDDPNSLGAFGLGFKSPLAYGAFYFTGWKDGVERKWVMREGEEETEIDLLYEKPSNEPTGAEVVIPIASYSDAREFSKKIREQLCYFSNVFIIDEYISFNNDFKIFQTEDFRWSEMCDSTEMHLCLADVYYPIDWKKLGISPINVPVGLRFSLSDGIEPLPARESFKYSAETKRIILEKIKKVATWFVERYNTTTHKQTIREAWDLLGAKHFFVTLQETDFQINDLLAYSDTPKNEITVEGITYRDPKWYKDNSVFFFNNYKIQGYTIVKQGRWKKEMKENEIYKKLMEGWQVIELSFTPTGKEKSYIYGKYSGQNYIFITELYERETGDELSHLETTQKAATYYRNMLELSTFPEDTWEDRILEFMIVEDEFKKEVINEKGFYSSAEFAAWVEKRRLRMAMERSYSSGGKGSRGGKDKEALNKKKGQITIGYARDHVHQKTVVFDRKAVDINTLHKLKHLSVYFKTSELNDELKKELYNYRSAFPSVRFVSLNDTEVKHVENLLNTKEKDKNKNKTNPFITFKQFKMSTPFARLATALLISETRDLEPDNKSFIYSTFPKYQALREKLIAYENKNYISASKAVADIIIKEAGDTNNWDFTIYSDVREFESVVKKFSFLEFLNIRSQFENTESVVKNMIYIVLKGQKIHSGLVEDFDLVPRIPVEVLEENYREETVDSLLENALQSED